MAGKLITAFWGYQFLREDCLKNSFKDSVPQNYLASLKSSTAFTCLDSNSVDVHIYSERNVSNVVEALSDKNFSMEMWLNPYYNPQQEKSVFSFALPSLINFGSCDSNLEILQLPTLNSSLSKFGINSCNSKTSTSLEFDEIDIGVLTNTVKKIIHLVFIFSFSAYNTGKTILQEMSTELIVNGISRGVQVYLSSSSLRPSNWNTGSILHLYPYNTNPSQSSLYKMFMYNQALNTDDANTLFEQGLPNARPVLHNATWSILENGLGNDTSSDPLYYLTPVPNSQLPVVALPVYDFDDDPISPNFSPSNAIAKVFFVNKPSLGQLYYLNGSIINLSSNIPVPYDTTTGQYAVRYRPPYNVVSSSNAAPLVNLVVSAVDGVTGQPALSTSLVAIVVKKVVKPPTIIASSAYSIKAKTLYSNFTLQGTADDGNTVKKIFIATYPLLGLLYQIDRSTGQKMLLSSLLNSIIVDQNTHVIAYYYKIYTLDFSDTEKLSSSSNPKITGASFAYGVIDNTGKKSLLSTVQLNIFTSVAISNKTIWRSYEEQTTLFPITGSDSSNLNRSVSFSIDRCPPNANATLINNNRTLSYAGRVNFFTSPNTTWTGETIVTLPAFDRLYLSGYTGDDAESVTTLQNIKVVNVNDPTTIDIEGKSSFVTYAFGGETDDSASYSMLTFSNIVIEDPDLGVDPVHVEIYATNQGKISLNSTALNLHGQYVDFNSESLCSGQTWQCFGSGYDASNMSFVTSPAILQQLLNGMTYVNILPNVKDTFVIRISDGEGGSTCLSHAQLGSGSVRMGCFRNSLALQVEVQGFYNKGNNIVTSKSTSVVFLSLQYVLLALAILVALLCCRCFYLSRKRKPQRKDRGEVNDIETGHKASKRESSNKLSPTSTIEINFIQQSSPKKLDDDGLDEKEVKLTVNKYDRERRSLRKYNTPERKNSNKKMRTPPTAKMTNSLSRRSSSKRYYSAVPVSTPDRGGSSDDSLPSSNQSDWTAHRHSSGRIYYYSHKTKKSTWKKPS